MLVTFSRIVDCGSEKFARRLRESDRRRDGHPAGPIRMEVKTAKYRLGDIVKHRIYPFRGVVYDVDPVFANTEEWWQSIPAAIRPKKDQPFYHLYAENAQGPYIAYVSEQNLLPDDSSEPVYHPQIEDTFAALQDGSYVLKSSSVN